MMTKKQVKAALKVFFKYLGGCVGGFLLLAGAFPLQGYAEPSASDILQQARLTQGSQHRVLLGQLRTGPKVIPFRLVLNGPEIRYEFTNPKQILVVKMGDQGSRLEEITKEGAERVPFSHFDAPVRGSDITFEDLSLRFLYWKDAKIRGTEKISFIDFYKLELHPSGVPSQYGTVIAWIGVNSGALAKAECYGRDGKLAARFTVTHVQRLSDGTGIFRQMRIERMVDGKEKDSAPSYLEITGEGT